MKKTLCLALLLTLIISCVSNVFATSDNMQDESDNILENSDIPEDGIMPINEDGIMPINMDYPDDELYTNRYNYEDYALAKDDLFESKQEVQYEGLNLNGNAYIFSKNAFLKDSTIKGNVFICAENVQFDNVLIEGSLYLAANKAELYIYTQDAYIAAKRVNFSPMTTITRTVKAAADEINLKGTINKNCYLGVNKLVVDENCRVLGDLEYSSEEEVNIAKANVTGNVKYNRIEKKDIKIENEFKISKIVSVVINTFIIAGIILLLRNNSNNNKVNVTSSILSSLGIGFIAFIIIPIISVVLLITIIGAGIGVILFTLYLLIILNAISIVSLEIALMINSYKENSMNNWQILGIAILIALVLAILKYVPAIESIVPMALPLLALGIVLKTIFRKKEKVSEPVIKEV